MVNGISGIRRMRAVSCLTFMSWLGLLLVAGSTGCADSIRLSRARTTELVEGYAKDRDAVIFRGARRYRLRSESGAELELGDEPESSAPLDQLKTRGKKVVFPDGAEVDPEELESAHLVVHGEPLVRLESEGQNEHSERFLAGVSVGGTGAFQLIFRVRTVGPLYFEVGGMVLPDFLNGSAGLLVDVPLAARFTAYGGAGVGALRLVSADYSACERTNDASCQGEVEAVDTLTVVNGRVGIAYRLLQSHFRLGLDGGVWYGRHVEDSWAGEPDQTDTILWPMAGFTALYEF
jgi:hypothetical protein